MKKNLFRLGVIALMLTGGPAVAGDSNQIEILDRMFAALGGRAAINELRSLAVEADCTGPDGDFRTRVESLRPDSVFFAQSDGEGATEIFSTSTRTWRNDPKTGTQDLSADVRSFVRAHEFHLLLFELESRFSNHRLGEATSFRGERCREILMEDEAGLPASLYLSTDESLPMALELNPRDAEGPIRITFDDWRRLGNLLYFFSFQLTEGPDRTFTYDYQIITPNSVLADRFVPRAAPAERQDQEALLKILRDDRQAHLETDAELLATNLASTLVEISNGEIHARTKGEVEEFFAQYFDGASYLIWEDARPPLIRISSDGSMAWVARSVIIQREEAHSNGSPEAQEASSAYTATYEKLADGWKMTSVTSTFLQR